MLRISLVGAAQLWGPTVRHTLGGAKLQLPEVPAAARHVQIRLPGPAPVDLCMVLASGRAASGLLGTTSLTYQVWVAAAARGLAGVAGAWSRFFYLHPPRLSSALAPCCLHSHPLRGVCQLLHMQIVGRPVAIARELMEGQQHLPFMVRPCCPAAELRSCWCERRLCAGLLQPARVAPAVAVAA